MTTEQPQQSIVISPPRPYMISQENKRLLKIVQKRSLEGRNDNIIIRGPTGVGKSEMVNQFAASNKRPLATLEIGRLSESSQIFGYMDLKEGQTQYVKGLFTNAITTPNCVVHLQELNRPESDKALNAIFAVLDDAFRNVWLDEIQGYVKVAPGVTFFATLNEGYEFIGTIPLDAALENRFPFKLGIGYLPSNYEETLLILKGVVNQDQAKQIVDFVNTLRHNTQDPIHISTRDTIFIAQLVKEGLTSFQALRTVVGGDINKLESILLSTHLAGSDLGETDITQQFEML